MYWPSMTAELKEYISQCEDTTSPTTSEQTPSDTPNKNQEKIQARANSTQEASVQSGANQQVVHAPVAQRPKRTIREPAYFKDYLH